MPESTAGSRTKRRGRGLGSVPDVDRGPPPLEDVRGFREGVTAPRSGVENAATARRALSRANRLLRPRVSSVSPVPSAAAAATPATEKLGSRRIPSVTAIVSSSSASSPSRPLLTAASAAAAGLGGGAPDSAAAHVRRWTILRPRHRLHDALFDGVEVLLHLARHGGVRAHERLDDAGHVERVESEEAGVAGNLSVAVLYDATTTSIAHARTLRTKRDEPRSASYPARCAASGAERGGGAGSAVSAASAAMSATLPDPAPRPEPGAGGGHPKPPSRRRRPTEPRAVRTRVSRVRPQGCVP